uniref:Uncharacterized protein n=1 Tax=Clytia hemisphaerica TaxID=252671 RepID=A0A7M5XHM4_9CNID
FKQMMESAERRLKLIQEDIEDFIDENPIIDLVDIDEISDSLNTIGTLKASFKQLHADLHTDDDQSYQTTLQIIKAYTKGGLAKKRTMKRAIAQTTQSAQVKSIEFATKSIQQKLKQTR